MPYYEYQCAANGRTVEVRHGMSEELTTWGQLVERAAVDQGETPGDADFSDCPSASGGDHYPDLSSALTGTSGDAGFQGCGTGCACAAQN